MVGGRGCPRWVKNGAAGCRRQSGPSHGHHSRCAGYAHRDLAGAATLSGGPGTGSLLSGVVDTVTQISSRRIGGNEGGHMDLVRARSRRQTRMGVVSGVAVAAALMLAACGGGGGNGSEPQSYPDQEISFIVPFAAGGPTDTVTRLVAEPMSAKLGQQIVVRNVEGAGGTVAAGRGRQRRPRRLHGADAPHRHVHRAGAVPGPGVQAAGGLQDRRPGD